VLFVPLRPVAEIGSVLKMADALLVHLKDHPLFEITIQSKTQAYLALGRPIIMAVRGDATELVEKAGAGITCIPEDAESIVSAFNKIFHMSKEERSIMGNNGFKYYRQELA
jgi:glycosyltransferase involved in cell wall biosynthesis